MERNWTLKAFNQLSTVELYAVLQLRNEVFVVEQNCPYQDVDGKDLVSFHLMAWHDEKLIAYCRILPPGLSYPEMSIGRVINHIDYRGQQLGKQLMNKAIEFAIQQYGPSPIKIGAQFYLKKFYESFGFIQSSDVYLEDDIEHIEMIRTSNT